MDHQTDTDPRAERVWLSLIRQASTAQRFALVREGTSRAIQLSRRALQRQMPDATDEQILIEFVRLHHGPELADRLRAYLEQRRAK